MYLGLTRTGASYMILFFAAMALSSLPGLSLFGFAALLVWCLAFFDCLNKAGLYPEELAAVEDEFFLLQFIPLTEEGKVRLSGGKWTLALGALLILAGGYALLQVLLYDLLRSVLNPTVVSRILRYLSTFVASGLLIFAGVWLIRGYKREEH